MKVIEKQEDNHTIKIMKLENNIKIDMIRKCKDIPDKPIMEFLLRHKGQWCNWYFEDERDVRIAMPKNLASEKLILAKMRQLIKRGLVYGCTCGCRGDFEITQKGEEWLSLQ